MLQTSANPTRRINASSGFYYAVLPSFAGWPFILVRCPYLLPVWAAHVRSRVSLLVCVPLCTCMHCVYESACLLPAWDLKSSSQRGLNHSSTRGFSRAVSGLSYQSIDVAPALPVALGGRRSRRPGAPPRRNTNGDADSFWFGHLSRHWSPCGLRRWWQMDCHLWMRGDWDTSPHISLSGVQPLPLCVSLYPSFAFSPLMSLLCFTVGPPFIPQT